LDDGIFTVEIERARTSWAGYPISAVAALAVQAGELAGEVRVVMPRAYVQAIYLQRRKRELEHALGEYPLHDPPHKVEGPSMGARGLSTSENLLGLRLRAQRNAFSKKAATIIRQESYERSTDKCIVHPDKRCTFAWIIRKKDSASAYSRSRGSLAESRRQRQLRQRLHDNVDSAGRGRAGLHEERDGRG
jgi:hypothetical protein